MMNLKAREPKDVIASKPKFMIICTKCKISKLENDFYARKPGNLRTECKQCTKTNVKINYGKNIEYHRAIKRERYKNFTRYENYSNKYGINKYKFKELVVIQNGKCWICREKKDEYLNVDHCHKTGEFRGIICKDCNMGIGLFKDNTDNLYRAIRYLTYNGRQYAIKSETANSRNA